MESQNQGDDTNLDNIVFNQQKPDFDASVDTSGKIGFQKFIFLKPINFNTLHKIWMRLIVVYCKNHTFI